jgi:hypothetical protein
MSAASARVGSWNEAAASPAQIRANCIDRRMSTLPSAFALAGVNVSETINAVG